VAPKGKDLQIIPRRLGNGRTQRPRKRLKETDHQGLRRHNPGVGIMELVVYSWNFTLGLRPGGKA